MSKHFSACSNILCIISGKCGKVQRYHWKYRAQHHGPYREQVWPMAAATHPWDKLLHISRDGWSPEKASKRGGGRGGTRLDLRALICAHKHALPKQEGTWLRDPRGSLPWHSLSSEPGRGAVPHPIHQPRSGRSGPNAGGKTGLLTPGGHLRSLHLAQVQQGAARSRGPAPAAGDPRRPRLPPRVGCERPGGRRRRLPGEAGRRDGGRGHAAVTEGRTRPAVRGAPRPPTAPRWPRHSHASLPTHGRRRGTWRGEGRGEPRGRSRFAARRRRAAGRKEPAAAAASVTQQPRTAARRGRHSTWERKPCRSVPLREAPPPCRLPPRAASRATRNGREGKAGECEPLAAPPPAPYKGRASRMRADRQSGAGAPSGFCFGGGTAAGRGAGLRGGAARPGEALTPHRFSRRLSPARAARPPQLGPQWVEGRPQQQEGAERGRCGVPAPGTGGAAVTADVLLARGDDAGGAAAGGRAGGAGRGAGPPALAVRAGLPGVRGVAAAGHPAQRLAAAGDGHTVPRWAPPRDAASATGHWAGEVSGGGSRPSHMRSARRGRSRGGIDGAGVGAGVGPLPGPARGWVRAGAGEPRSAFCGADRGQSFLGEGTGGGGGGGPALGGRWEPAVLAARR